MCYALSKESSELLGFKQGGRMGEIDIVSVIGTSPGSSEDEMEPGNGRVKKKVGIFQLGGRPPPTLKSGNKYFFFYLTYGFPIFLCISG